MFDSNRNNPAIRLEGPFFGTVLGGRQSGVTRLLLPVDATEKSRLGLQHIGTLRRAGQPVEVCLLNVEDTARNLEVVSCMTREEMDEFHHERAQFILSDAAKVLVDLGIPHQAFFCIGDIAEAINFAARHLECDAVILPEPHPAWQHLFCEDHVRDLLEKPGHAQIILVDGSGRVTETETTRVA